MEQKTWQELVSLAYNDDRTDAQLAVVYAAAAGRAKYSHTAVNLLRTGARPSLRLLKAAAQVYEVELISWPTKQKRGRKRKGGLRCG